MNFRTTRDRQTSLTRNATYILSLVCIIGLLARAKDMEIKRCSRCKLEKSVAEFHKQRSNKDGLKYYCKNCASIANKKCWASGKGVKSVLETQKRAQQLKRGTKYCPVCKQVLPIELFGVDNRDKNGIMVNCKTCEQTRKKQYNPTGAKTEAEYEQRSHYFRMASLKKRYGLTELDFQEMMNEQKGCCAICEKDFSELSTRAAVDHDHNTGVIRGLLCPRCNNLLGAIESNECLLSKIVEYKDRY